MNWFKCSHANVWEQLNIRLATLESRVLSLELSQEAFRNKVLRKIQGKKDEIDEEAEKAQDIYSKVLLPDK